MLVHGARLWSGTLDVRLSVWERVVVVLQVLAGIGGVVLVLTTLLSAVRTVVVPRGEQVLITRAVFAATRWVVDLLVRLRRGYDWTDAIMSLYAPVALLLLPLVWMTLLFIAFALLFWAVGEGSFRLALELSGSSLLTLGFTKPATDVGLALSFMAAGLAIAIVVLLLVTYLPTMYASFAERERLVTLLETRAGAPASATVFLERMGRIRGLGELEPIWDEWEDWFARVQESHTSQPALAFFRSQRMDQNWVTAAGALLDAAALYVACLDHEAIAGEERPIHTMDGDDDRPPQRVRHPSAEVCIRAGYLSLREVAGFFRLPFDHDPHPTSEISVTREEFDEVWTRLTDSGLPLVADRDAAWAAYAGWRVNYDEPLLRLAAMTVAPDAPWSNDEPRRAWLAARMR